MASVEILMGSKSDIQVAQKAADVLKKFGIEYKINIASAHRTPHRVEDIVRNSKADVFIAIAGLSAALPGVVASHTIKPVIGVPVSGNVNLDSILSIVQMPPGVPVGAVGLDRGENAGILAAEILALSDKALAERIMAYRKEMESKIIEEQKSLG